MSFATAEPADLIEPAVTPAPVVLATDREIRARVLKLAAPISLEYLLQTSVSAINTWQVSRLGSDALAGVGIAQPIIYFCFAFFSSISIGGTVLVANAFGAGEPKRAGELARQALVWGVLLAIPLSVAGYFISAPVVSHFGDDANVHAIGATYLQIVTSSSVVMLITFLSSAILRGAGDGKTPLKSAILANISSVLASYLLIEGHLGFPDWGIKGAAWGTVIGRLVGALFLLGVLWSGRARVTIHGRKGWFPHYRSGREIFRLGLPAAAEQLSNETGFITLTALAASVGAAALTAHQIGLTAMDVWFLPGMAFGVTATSLVGQSVGAGRIREGAIAQRHARNFAFLWMFAGTILFALGATVILKLFTSDPEVIATGRNLVRVIGLQLPLWGLVMVATGGLRGSGDTRTPMVRGITATWTTVMIAWVGVHFFNQGVAWVWGAYIFTWPILYLLNQRAFVQRARRLEVEGF